MGLESLIPAGLGIVGGAIQAIAGGGSAKRAQNEMERMANNYQTNAGINDFYSKAYNNYSENPYNSHLYQMSRINAERGVATGINAANDRRSGAATIGALVAGSNDALLKASATAEGQKSQALNTLGTATQMKAAEDFKPFEMKYNLQNAKAAGANQTMNAGLSNLYGGLSGASMQLSSMANQSNSGYDTPSTSNPNLTMGGYNQFKKRGF